jgi:hypothetical protein
MTNVAMKTPGIYALRVVADALDSAVEAAKNGTGPVAPTPSGIMRSLSGMLSGLTFNTCYAISYGVVFPTLVAAHAIPRDNPAVNGLIGGSRAARDALDELKSSSVRRLHSDSAPPNHGNDEPPAASGS